MTAHKQITLYVMQGCQLCPQMEHLFQKMQQSGKIESLRIFDLSEHPEHAKQLGIRSVPFYQINGVSFTGLRTVGEIASLLEHNDGDNWAARISEEFHQGQLSEVETLIREQPMARKAMLQLLADPKTELVVRIGLTAVVESLSGSEWLRELDGEFIQLTDSQEQRIALDALYYLRLIGTSACLDRLREVSLGSDAVLAGEARELLDELQD